MLYYFSVERSCPRLVCTIKRNRQNRRLHLLQTEATQTIQLTTVGEQSHCRYAIHMIKRLFLKWHIIVTVIVQYRNLTPRSSLILLFPVLCDRNVCNKTEDANDKTKYKSTADETNKYTLAWRSKSTISQRMPIKYTHVRRRFSAI